MATAKPARPPGTIPQKERQTVIAVLSALVRRCHDDPACQMASLRIALPW